MRIVAKLLEIVAKLQIVASNASTSARWGRLGWAPGRVTVRAPAALAKRVADSRVCPSASATPRPAFQASPAAVVSIAVTGKAGTVKLPAGPTTIAPRSPRLTITWRAPRASNRRAAASTA